MQSGKQPTDPNLTTGTRHYSLVSLAEQAETQAREKWLKAGARYEADRSTFNLAVLIDASDELKRVQEKADNARAIYKHNHLIVKK